MSNEATALIELAPATAEQSPLRKLRRPNRMNLRKERYVTPEEKARRERETNLEVAAFIAARGVRVMDAGSAHGIHECLSVGNEI